MADITMCTNESCPMWDHCYRAQAAPNKYRQSYSQFEWKQELEDGPISCDYFWACED